MLKASEVDRTHFKPLNKIFFYESLKLFKQQSKNKWIECVKKETC